MTTSEYYRITYTRARNEHMAFLTTLTRNTMQLLLQEQYWSRYTKSSPTHHAWTLIEPPTTSKTPRTAIYTNNCLLSASQVTPMELPFSDTTAIVITTTDTSKPALIINIYNPCNNSILADLHDYLHTNININEYGTVIITGDFNTHHPLWNPTGYTRHDQ